MTVSPISRLAGGGELVREQVKAPGVGVGGVVGVAVGEGGEVGVEVGAPVGVGLGEGVSVGVGVGDGDGVGLEVGVGVGEGIGEEVGVGGATIWIVFWQLPLPSSLANLIKKRHSPATFPDDKVNCKSQVLHSSPQEPP